MRRFEPAQVQRCSSHSTPQGRIFLMVRKCLFDRDGTVKKIVTKRLVFSMVRGTLDFNVYQQFL